MVHVEQGVRLWTNTTIKLLSNSMLKPNSTAIGLPWNDVHQVDWFYFAVIGIVLIYNYVYVSSSVPLVTSILPYTHVL